MVSLVGVSPIDAYTLIGAAEPGAGTFTKSSAWNTGRISISASLPYGVRAAPDPLERLLHRLHLPDPVTGDELLGLRERAFDHEPFSTGEPHPLALAAGLKAFPGQQDPGPYQLLVELAHRRL